MPKCDFSWPATLLKKRLWHRCFPVNFAKFLRTPFLTEHLRAIASLDGATISVAIRNENHSAGRSHYALTFKKCLAMCIIDVLISCQNLADNIYVCFRREQLGFMLSAILEQP